MFFRHRFNVLLLTAGLMSTHVFAEGSGLGVINPRRILSESSAAKAGLIQFEKDFSPKLEALKAQGAALQDMKDNFEKMAPTFSDAQRLENQKKLTSLNRDFLRNQQQFIDDREARKREDIQQIMRLAAQAVQKLAASENYDLVLEGGIFTSSTNDITDKVIKSMNDQAQQ